MKIPTVWGKGENTLFADQSRKKEQDNGHDRYQLNDFSKNRTYSLYGIIIALWSEPTFQRRKYVCDLFCFSSENME